MREPVFESPSGADGRRARSLDLYGATAAYRREDGLARDFAEIVRVAAGATGAGTSTLDLWGVDGLIPIARTPLDTTLGTEARTTLGGRLPAEVVVVDGGRTRSGPTVVAPLLGREGVALGLLAVGFAAPHDIADETVLLLKHLAGAAVGVLDRQRRAWERRGRPGAAPLRAVGGRERRADLPDE